MRTPKIEALHRMIKWCNYNHYGVSPKAEIIPLGIDISPLQNNNWLSGFLDGDCSFYFNWLYDKKNLPTSLQYYMRISQRQDYHHINDFFSVSYFNIMNKIALFLSVPLRFRTRNRKNEFIESLYEVRSANYISNYTVLSYLLKYPLFSYKYRAVTVQLELLKLSKNKNYKLPSCGRIKSSWGFKNKK
jgi:LAGLIDADG endonuclease